MFSYYIINIIIKSQLLWIDSPDWIKNKKTTINPINKKDNKCFQSAVTFALNYEEIKRDPQRITEIKTFIKNITGKEQVFHHKKMIGKK